ncbi:Predicted arabinose efflux permease, MFS family [Rhizobium sp. RU35A]|uniref:MFS transporter n=1 Tax=Rhizobium sp. RU35A TaxID=1907414 RepID=UPI000955DC2E|nr:MFS transporter [Rhizobium sp. RU35A]SIQ77330.1 Predicted arabinose efflux permease, MFS family [Rhizobium sp. RU35A]
MSVASSPQTGSSSGFLTDRSLVALAVLNFFLADARDGLGPFLDAFLATNGWSSMALGAIATAGGLIGLVATPIFGELVDNSRWKRALIAGPVIFVTIAALVTLLSPNPAVVWFGQMGTALVGAVIGPALAGLTLGLVGERLFARQIARNEFWNHGGNFLSLFAVFLVVPAFGTGGMTWLMIATALGTLAAIVAIDPNRIDHDVARGLDKDAGSHAPSGIRVLLRERGLLLLAIILLIFHFGNAPMGRLIAQDFALELQTPFRTTAIITGVAQAAMILVAALAPMLIRRFGLLLIFLVALSALPLRGLLAGSFSGFWVIYPVQFLDGVGAGLLGILTPVAVEHMLKGTGRFNLGLASVMTIQGVGASLSNVVAGWLVTKGGFALSHFVGGGIAFLAMIIFILFRRDIIVDDKASQT